MKKLILLALGITVFQLSNAQSFYKHALVISADYGFEAYSLIQQYTLEGLDKNVTSSGSAANTNFSFGVEYGLTGWLGIGLQGKLDNYSISKDSGGYVPTNASGEIGALINVHIIHIDKIDLMAGVNLGFSTVTYKANSYSDQFFGDNLWSDVHVTFRYYFGRFGLNASAYIPFSSYRNFTSNNSDWYTGQAVLNQWKSSGGGFSLGMQFRFCSIPKV